MRRPSIENAAETRRVRRAHLLANLVFLLAGLGFGSAVYLARTRFHKLVAGGRTTAWILLVAAGVAVFVLASRLQGRARRLERALRRASGSSDEGDEDDDDDGT